MGAARRLELRAAVSKNYTARAATSLGASAAAYALFLFARLERPGSFVTGQQRVVVQTTRQGATPTS